jgi:hypothetical protein
VPSSWVASSRANSTLASLLSAYARSSCRQPITGWFRRVKSRCPRRWAAEDTTTTRLGAHIRRWGSSRCVSRKGLTWFTRNSRLKASRVRPQELIPGAGARCELPHSPQHPHVCDGSMGHPSHVSTGPWQGPNGGGNCSWPPTTPLQGLLPLTSIMDEDVQPWLRAQEGSGKGPHRGQTGQVQGHEDDLIVPTLLWSGKGWDCHQAPPSSSLSPGA